MASASLAHKFPMPLTCKASQPCLSLPLQPPLQTIFFLHLPTLWYLILASRGVLR